MKKYLLIFILLLLFIPLFTLANSENCTEECEAYVGYKRLQFTYCQNKPLNVSTDSYNKDSLYTQTYLLTLRYDTIVVAINEAGIFEDLEQTRYTIYGLNYAKEDALIPTVGESINLLEGCYDLRKFKDITIVAPIEVLAEPVCIEGYGHLIDLTISKGLTAHYGAFGHERKYQLNFNNIANQQKDALWRSDSSFAKVRVANENYAPFEEGSEVTVIVKDGDHESDCFVELSIPIEASDNCEIFLKAIPDYFVIYSNYAETYHFNVLDNDIGGGIYVSSLHTDSDKMALSWKLNGELSLTATTFCAENYGEEITYTVKDQYGNESTARILVYIFREDVFNLYYEKDCYVSNDYGFVTLHTFISGGTYPQFIYGNYNDVFFQPDTIEILMEDWGYAEIAMQDTLWNEGYFSVNDVGCHHYYAPMEVEIDCITDTSATYTLDEEIMIYYYELEDEDVLGTPNNSTVYDGETYFSYFDSGWDLPYPVYGTVTCFKGYPDYLKTRFHTKAAIINVLCNDVSLTPSLQSIETPQNGTLEWEADGTVYYTPNENFVGLERLKYVLQNAVGRTDTSILTIQVTAEDGIPLLVPPLEVDLERDCSNFETTGMYEIYLNIGGGYPPYTISGDTSLVLDTATTIGPLFYNEGEGYAFCVEDSKYYSYEINEKYCVPSCLEEGGFSDAYQLICQENNTAVLEYQICLENWGGNVNPYYYYLVGNKSGDVLEAWEEFAVYAIAKYESDTIWQLKGINNCLELPELTASNDSLLLPTDTFKIFNVFGNDIGNELILEGVFTESENITFNWFANGSIYLETGNQADTVLLQYVVGDSYTQKDTAEIWIQIYEPFVFEAEKDCSSIIPNEFCKYTLNAIMYGGVTPYHLKLFNSLNDSLLHEKIFEQPPVIYSHLIPYDANLYLIAEDTTGESIFQGISSICPSFGCAYYPCNEACIDTDLAIENVQAICNGNGTADLTYEIVGGNGSYTIECGYESGTSIELNELIPEYHIVVLDGNNCSAEVFVNIEACIPTLQNDTLYLETNSTDTFNIFQNDIGEGLKLDTVFILNGMESFTWFANGNIYFEAANEENISLLQYVTTDQFLQQDTAQIWVQTLLPFTAEFRTDCVMAQSSEMAIVKMHLSGGLLPYQVTGTFDLTFENATGYYDLVIPDNSFIDLQITDSLSNTVLFQEFISCSELCADLQLTTSYDCFLDSNTQDSLAIFSYEITGGDGNYTSNGNTQNDTLQNGEIYHIEIMDGNRCTVSISDTIDCQFTSISTIKHPISNIQLYPNPNNGNFTLSLQLEEAETIEIKIIDILEQVKLWQQFPTLPTVERQNFDLNLDLPSGLYFLQIKGKDWRWTEKIIVR